MLTDSENSQCSQHYSPENRNCGNNVFEKSNNCTEPVIASNERTRGISSTCARYFKRFRPDADNSEYTSSDYEGEAAKKERKQDSNGPILKKKPMKRTVVIFYINGYKEVIYISDIAHSLKKKINL